MKRFVAHGLVVLGLLFLAAVAGVFSAVRALAQTVVKAALVKNVDEPWRMPYRSFGESLHCDQFSCTISGFDAVPAGKRLVVTEVSGFVSAPSSPQALRLGSSDGLGTSVFLPIAGSLMAPGIGQSWVVTLTVQVNVDEGGVPVVLALPGLTAGRMMVNGYLIDRSN